VETESRLNCPVVCLTNGQIAFCQENTHPVAEVLGDLDVWQTVLHEQSGLLVDVADLYPNS
jgi:hypothetical protein